MIRTLIFSSPDYAAEFYLQVNNACPDQTSQMNVLPEFCISDNDTFIIYTIKI